MNANQATRTLIWLNIPVYLAIGLAALLAPTWLAGLVGIQLEGPTALADFRAMYGGLSLGAGFTMLVGVRRDAWLQPLLALVGLCSLELALGRAYSWAVSGTPEPIIFVMMGLEVGCVAAAAWCYHGLTDTMHRTVTA